MVSTGGKLSDKESRVRKVNGHRAGFVTSEKSISTICVVFIGRFREERLNRELCHVPVIVVRPGSPICQGGF